MGDTNHSNSATLDITPIMDILLAETRCQQVERIVHEFDLSWDTPLRIQLRQQSAKLIHIIQPLLTTKQVTRTTEIDQLCQEALIDLQDEEIQGKVSIITVVGKLPKIAFADA